VFGDIRVNRLQDDRTFQAFLLVFALVAFVGVASFQAAQGLVVTTGWVAHTQEMMFVLEDTLTTFVDAETGQRGYLLTNNGEYLQPYYIAVISIRGNLERLEQLTVGDADQQARLEQLRTLTREHLAIIEQLIRNYRAGDPDNRKIHLLEAARQWMTEIRTVITDMKDAENRQLLQRTDQASRDVQSVFLTFFALSLLVLALVALTYLVIRRENARRRHSEQGFQLLVESVRDYAISMLAPDGRIASWNAGAERLNGYAAADIIGHPFSRLYPPDAVRRGEPERLLDAARRAGQVEAEGWRRRQDGSLFWANDIFTQLRDEQGNPRGFVNVTRDFSQHKRAEDDLLNALQRERELGKLKSRFVTVVSHEFRTPLATIQLATDLLRRYSERMDAERIDQHIGNIQVQIKHLTQMLDDVLTVEKAETVGLAFNPVSFKLTQVIERMVEDAQRAAPERAIETRMQVDRDEVALDETLLREIITNLLSNAVKYSPDDKPVRLEVTATTENVRLVVRDEGIGIPPDDLPHLFDVFHRSQNVSNIQGVGLGLAIVKRAVDKHGGTIAVDSLVDAGTTFTVTLPLHPPPET